MLMKYRIGNFALLPLRTRTRGPAYTLPPLPPSITSDLDIDPDSEHYDILDETITLFRANTLFRNFEIKGPADRTLIYGILWISDCLGKIKPNMSLRDSEKVLHHYYSLSLCYGNVVNQQIFRSFLRYPISADHPPYLGSPNFCVGPLCSSWRPFVPSKCSLSASR